MNEIQFYDIIPKDYVLKLAGEIQLPAFVYFSRIVKSKYDQLLYCLPEKFAVHYALKANPNKKLLQYIRSLGLGADVGSLGELQLAEDAGYPPEKIEFTGPGKTSQELSYAIDLGISAINIESISEIEKIVHICTKKNKTANVGIRLNSARQTQGSRIKMSGDTQFGIIEDDVNKALEIIRANATKVNFVGLHMHLGSQILESQQLLSNFKFILERAYEIKNSHKINIAKINFGGGWGVDMFASQASLDLSLLKKTLSDLLADSKCRSSFRNTRFIIEPGRFLVAESGVYLVKIVTRKKGYRKEFLIVDGGMHQLYAAAGGIGQVFQRNYQIDIVSKTENAVEKKNFTITGNLCAPADVLANNIQLDRQVAEGDILAFFNSGAYGYTASPTGFLSHALPTEIVV
jgi:diaminopimelate decarboxylase